MPPATASALAGLRRLTPAPRRAGARAQAPLVSVCGGGGAQPRDKRLHLFTCVEAVAQSLAYQHRDRHRVTLSEVQEGSPVFNFRQAPSALGDRKSTRLNSS